MQIKKAVFPVAGLGTRFLPATKANPKEMLPLVDKPLIQYAVEEAARAGITHMVFITSSSKRAIEDHFDNHFELESHLQEEGKENLLQLVKNVSPPGIHFTYVRQNQPLGLGHAILCAEHVIGKEPFAVLLADDLINDWDSPCLAAMTEHFHSTHHSIFAVQEVPWPKVCHYGIVKIASPSSSYSKVEAIIEKPSQVDAPSNLAAVGRYVFTPAIFSALKKVTPDKRGELQLTDGIHYLLQEEMVYTFLFRGKRYDCGSKIGYLQAMIDLALSHKEIGEEFADYLKTLH